jgi:RHS repeat-associated protein
MFRDGDIYWYHSDALGSITELTDDSQAVVCSYDYSAFGTIISESGTLKNPFTYTAREYDSESGLHYYRARYYDAGVGRFLSRDPIRYNAGVNLYVYVGNNTIIFVDPMGLYIPGERWMLRHGNEFTLVVGGASMVVIGVVAVPAFVGLGAAGAIGGAHVGAGITGSLVVGGVGLGGVANAFSGDPLPAADVFINAIPTPMGVPWEVIGDFAEATYQEIANPDGDLPACKMQ